MVLLHFRTDNSNNISLAKFDTIYNQSYIQFSNINNNNLFLIGLSNNNFKCFNPNLSTDDGLLYNNNILSINTINTKFLKNNDVSIFPNIYTSGYEISGQTGGIVPTDPSRCFDMNDDTIWQSVATYDSLNGSALTFNQNYRFGNSYGDWIKIKFPYQIIPIGFYVSNTNKFGDPVGFDFYVSNDNTNWIKIGSVANISSFNTNTFTFINNDFYLYIALVITKIINDPSNLANQYFELKTLQILSKPIINIDTKIKICNNNIFDIDTISAKRLLLNNSAISSGTDLDQAIVNLALNAFQQQYSIYWKNSNSVGFPDSNIINKIAINKTTAISTLDINGSISFNNRIINKKIEFTNINPANNSIINYPSSYLFIGEINLTSITNKGFFKLSLFSFDTLKYYFQTINIYGYTFLEGATSFKLYWDTSVDNNFNIIQRFVDVFYYLDITLTSTSIKFYIKFNDALDIPLLNSQITNRDLFTNIIYIDQFYTSSSTDINFIPASSISFFSLLFLSSPYLYKATNISTIYLNSNINFFNSNVNNYLKTNEFIINNPSIKTSNLLFLDDNYKIADSGISSNIISGLKNINFSSNKIIATNNLGSLTAIDVSCNLMININTIANTSSNILISSNGIFEPLTINKNNLINLNSINNISNSILIINSNSQLQTTSSLNINNINNVLNLFTFSNNIVFCNSNLSSTNFIVNSNLFINNILINSNNNRLFINNNQLPDDIFKIIIKFPPNDLTPVISINNSFTSDIKAYNLNYNNNPFFNLLIKIYADDDNTELFKKPFNIFFRNRNRLWQTNNNFKNFNNINNNLGIIKYLENDTSLITKCGAFIIFEFTQFIILTSYVFYVYYTDIKNTIRDFKIFGFNNTTNSWTLIDFKEGIVLNNNLVPNVFHINKSNYNIFNKFAICILNTHNDNDTPNFCIINYVDFYGYTPFNNSIFNTNNISFNSFNNQTIIGFSNCGINNINPFVPLSIGNDLIDNSTEAILNLNHSSLVSPNNIEKPIITLTRPTNNTFGGIKAVHYLNSWYESNSIYSIKLSHNYSSNEKIVLSLSSDGKVGIGDFPDSNLINNGLNIFNNGLNFYRGSNYINLHSPNILNSYNLCFPNKIGSVNNTLVIDYLSNNIAYLNWYNPLDVITSNKTFIKFGDQNVPNRTDNGIVFQIAGGCLIGSNNISSNDISDEYIKNNILVVSGSIYATNDISTDSDISYKYNIKPIYNSLNIINKINGYTFNRNDVNNNDTTHNQRFTGLIAQEVVKVMPEVITRKHDGKLRIIYPNLAGLFVEAIKSLNNNFNYINFKVNLLIFFSSFAFLYIFFIK
jgi:hypothetical protein